MRTRYRKSTLTDKSLIIRYYRDQKTETDKEFYGNNAWISESSITDRVGPNWNPVSHTKREWDVPKPLTLPMSYSKRRGFPLQFEFQGGLQLRNLPEIKPDLDWTDAMQALLDDARGNMSTNVNLVVNVAEAAQIKTLVPQILKSGKKIFKVLMEKHKTWHMKGSRKTFRELADGHLLYSFGLMPLLNDGLALVDITSAILARRKELENRNCRTIRISKRCYNEQTSKSTIGPVDMFGDFSYSGESENWSKVSGTVSADCTASYNLDHPSTRWKHVAQALGLTTPLQSIWEITPWSFVFDWVLPIGKALKFCEREALDLVGEAAVTTNYHLTNFGTSRKFEGISVPKCKITASSVPGWVGRQCDPAVQRWSKFERNIGEIPTYDWYGSVGDWSITKTMLGISLSLQKALGVKKPKGPVKLPMTLDFIHTKPR